MSCARGSIKGVSCEQHQALSHGVYRGKPAEIPNAVSTAKDGIQLLWQMAIRRIVALRRGVFRMYLYSSTVTKRRSLVMDRDAVCFLARGI